MVDDTDQAVADYIIRLVNIADRPNALTILQPSLMRELYYWLLTGPDGPKIARQLAVEAANRVGYESTSQFSREYSRTFGLPPARDTSYFYERID